MEISQLKISAFQEKREIKKCLSGGTKGRQLISC